MMANLGTTPPEATAYRPMTLPKQCYGAPGSRRWDVEADPPRGDTHLGETMEDYIRLYPDPRTAKGPYDPLLGTISPFDTLPAVVVRELIKYLPPMSVMHLANMSDRVREEVTSNNTAFENRICPCHTEIIGNQCWRHTKSETNLFRRLPTILMMREGEEGKSIAKEQVEGLRRRIDQNTIRVGNTKHYGGTEGWNRRYAKPSGLHDAMLAGNPQALAAMFPPGDIEGGIIHITVHATWDYTTWERREPMRTVINTMGLLLLRITGAAVTIHSIRMKGRLEQPQSDAMAELLRRQGGAACQLCIEGEQQITNTDRYNAPRWTTISKGDGGRHRLPPIPHLLHNYFVRASLLGIEEQTVRWGTSMSEARKDGAYSPERWRIVEPYLCVPRTGATRTPGALMSYQESPLLRVFNGRPYMEVRPRCSPIPPVSRQLTGRRHPEGSWRYLDHYDPDERSPTGGTTSGITGETTAEQLRAVRASRLGDIEIWEIDRQAAEWARYNETATPKLNGGFTPIFTDRRDLISEDEDSDTGKEVENDGPHPVRSGTYPVGETCSPPNSDSGSNGYIKFPMPEVDETPEHWQTLIRVLDSESEGHSDDGSEPEQNVHDEEYESGGSSETEPASPTQPGDAKYESGGSSETEPGSPHWSEDQESTRGEPTKGRTKEAALSEPIKAEEEEPNSTAWSEDRTEDKGEPSKIKTEEPILSESVKTEQEEESGIWEGLVTDQQPEHWSEPDPWSEPESPDTWEYYLTSDGVTRNYYFIEYGPRPGETKWLQKP